MIVDGELRKAAARLDQAGIHDGMRDARKIMRSVLKREGASFDTDQGLSEKQFKQFQKMVNQRVARQPVAQIIGKREFWGRNFKVTHDTLDPRPDSELLIELALNLPKPDQILDLGTGTGCLLLTLLAEQPSAEGTGTDISGAALKVAARNASVLGLTDRSKFVNSDWFSNINGTFDLILCNPPYISQAEMVELQPEVRDWEPHLALSPGGDGLGAYREISLNLSKHLNTKGAAIFEIGATQANAVVKLFRDSSFDQVEVFRDINQKERAIMVKKSGR